MNEEQQSNGSVNAILSSVEGKEELAGDGQFLKDPPTAWWCVLSCVSKNIFPLYCVSKPFHCLMCFYLFMMESHFPFSRTKHLKAMCY